MQNEQSTQIKLIKKYKNRRLYDLQRSQYVTVEDLQTYVLEDIEFRVQDANSGKDLTNSTLLQIFVDQELNSTQALSANGLRQLIKLSKHPMSEQYKVMLEQMLSKLQDHFPPFLQNVQATTELWMTQSQQFMKSWQDWLGKRGD